MRRAALIIIAVTAALHGAAFSPGTGPWAGTLTKEPEFDSVEYMLDLVTNRFDRLWREVYDAGDNRFRIRLGSNNYEQWFLEEQFKFSTDLASRLRFRYYHARIFRNSSEQLADDAFEFEGRVFGKNYLSFFATPTFLKADNSIGFMLQNRRAVNQYSILFVEFPQIVRNFTERHKGDRDTLLTVFTDKPIRFGVNIREPIGSNLWIRVTGEYIPSFEIADEIKSTGETIAKERIEAAGVAGWIEYVWRGDRMLSEQTALGLDWGARSEESSRWFGDTFTSPSLIPAQHQGLEDNRAPRLLEMELEDDLFERGADDSVGTWREKRLRAQPYLWLYLGPRVTARATLRLERREIAWTVVNGRRHRLQIDYAVGLAGLRTHFGSRRQTIVEGGLATELRRRHQQTDDTASTTDHHDHRAYLSFEYAFSETKRVRITEAFELDGEDIGELKIHDHGFIQMIFGF